MPELPEVETIVRSLAPQLTGQRVVAVRFLAPRVLRGAPEPSLNGHFIERVTRHGKHILFTFDHGTLAIHLGMTGKLLFNAEPSLYLRAEFLLPHTRLAFDDIRQFGRMAWAKSLPENVASLGPDPLEITEQHFQQLLANRQTAVKPLLLNQNVLRGLGNIYVDESLHRAKLSPLQRSASITPKQSKTLHHAIQSVLTEAIQSGGSSISDYVDTAGNKGSFQQSHRVYNRAGKPCQTCGTPIERTVVAQRGTHFCPRCQSLV